MLSSSPSEQVSDSLKDESSILQELTLYLPETMKGWQILLLGGRWFSTNSCILHYNLTISMEGKKRIPIWESLALLHSLLTFVAHLHEQEGLHQYHLASYQLGHVPEELFPLHFPV